MIRELDDRLTIDLQILDLIRIGENSYPRSYGDLWFPESFSRVHRLLFSVDLSKSLLKGNLL